MSEILNIYTNCFVNNYIFYNIVYIILYKY